MTRLRIGFPLAVVAFVVLGNPAAYRLNAAEKADKVRIFVYAEPERPTGTFLGGSVSRDLADTVKDVSREIDLIGPFRNWRTKHREEAAILVRVTGRDEVNGTYRVYTRITTTDGREATLTGSSAHQWKKAAKDLVDQLMTWVKKNEATLRTPDKS